MNDEIADLYRQIKEKRLDREEALKLLEKVGALSRERAGKGVSGSFGGVLASEILDEKAIDYFKKVLASSLQLPVERIEADAPLEKYGIDSILVTQLTTQLEKIFGSLSKTLFFEYQTIESLSRYFIEAHRRQLIQLLETDAPSRVSGARVEESGSV